MEIGAYEAKTHFSSLIERASRGERITITRRGKPVAELGPSGRVDPKAAQEAWDTLMANRERLRAEGKVTTTTEILDWIKEGRR
ncbi:type II toxin-antitoxin system Phd/YefM family antitoxin [Polycyclovorans algicola]|uniref:type II toxin-antitoxin system Phd/YefM family antitoxin n=1 Tax=Polycyclovorans algicola TaxID=616992 RepID=UPI0004A6AE04|nr:type II toxin-antitoxin system prevent-host-death family antitoxin [Polycyclovorans algicola]